MSRWILPLLASAAIALLGFADPAGAARPESKLAVEPAVTPRDFAKQVQELRANMQPGQRYAEVSTQERARIDADIDTIDKLLEKRGSADRLNPQEQTTVINAQERVNAILTKNDGDRLICRFERRTGSHFREKTCQTASEIARMRTVSQEQLRKVQQHHMQPPPGAGGQ